MKHLIKTLDKSHKALVEVEYPRNENELTQLLNKKKKIITIGSGLTFVPNFFSEEGVSVSLEKFENVIMPLGYD